MRVTDLSGARYELAVERFRNGHAILFENVSLRLTHDEVRVSVAATWQPESINEERARADFDTAAATLERLLQSSPQLANAVEDRDLKYELVHDYGGGGVLVARLVHGRVSWAAGFPRIGSTA